MLVHLIPVTQGMTREDIMGRLQAGWVLIGRQVVDLRTGVIDPTKPMTASGLVDVDIWALPEPTIPLGTLSNLILEAQKAAKPLEKLVESVFGVDFPTFLAKIDEQKAQSRLQ